MIAQKKKQSRLLRRTRHIRRHVRGAPDRPRLLVTRSVSHIYAQVIEHGTGKTLAAASTLEKSVAGEVQGAGNIAAAKAVGRAIARKALAQNITKVCFDRGGRKYHGRVKALADAAREGGLSF